jgi:hypothetical protein
MVLQLYGHLDRVVVQKACVQPVAELELPLASFIERHLEEQSSRFPAIVRPPPESWHLLTCDGKTYLSYRLFIPSSIFAQHETSVVT